MVGPSLLSMTRKDAPQAMPEMIKKLLRDEPAILAALSVNRVLSKYGSVPTHRIDDYRLRVPDGEIAAAKRRYGSSMFRLRRVMVNDKKMERFYREEGSRCVGGGRRSHGGPAASHAGCPACYVMDLSTDVVERSSGPGSNFGCEVTNGGRSRLQRGR